MNTSSNTEKLIELIIDLIEVQTLNKDYDYELSLIYLVQTYETEKVLNKEIIETIKERLKLYNYFPFSTLITESIMDINLFVGATLKKEKERTKIEKWFIQNQSKWIHHQINDVIEIFSLEKKINKLDIDEDFIDDFKWMTISNDDFIEEMDKFLNIEFMGSLIYCLYNLKLYQDYLIRYKAPNNYNLITKPKPTVYSYLWTGTSEQLESTYQDLKNESYIDKGTKYEDFRKVFNQSDIDSIQPIKWHNNSVTEVLYFIELLIQIGSIDKHPSRHKVLSKCFCNNKGRPYNYNSLRQIRSSISHELDSETPSNINLNKIKRLIL